MRSIVIFGERPGPNTDPKRPLYPHTTTGAAAKLIALLGMTQVQYLGGTYRFNVVNDRTTSTKDAAVRDRVRDLLRLYRDWGEASFVVLGREAAQAFPPEFRYQPFGYPKKDILIIPHTSGVNRYYNSLDSKLFIQQSLRDFLGRF